MEQSEEEILAKAFSILGKRRSEKKAASSRANGRAGGRPILPLEEIPCTCGGKGNEHTSRCPRGRAMRRRAGQQQKSIEKK